MEKEKTLNFTKSPMGGSKQSTEASGTDPYLWAFCGGSGFEFLYVIEYETMVSTSWARSTFSFSDSKCNAT